MAKAIGSVNTQFKIELFCPAIISLFQELSDVSMMDDFASYARTERKINKVKNKLTVLITFR